jgi:hypothetical protein
MDYIDWSRECYHRRLTMVSAPTYHPPLYPIPGEAGRGDASGAPPRLVAATRRPV